LADTNISYSENMKLCTVTKAKQQKSSTRKNGWRYGQ